MVTWRYAYEAARKGGWHIVALDRRRFETRIFQTSKEIEFVLNADHRSRIYHERFS